ncbi:MAG: oxygen-independent coproporphyrinogen III oxidase [Verrucomicrobia bacterium]|nr:oxygen-independent coproporphyrinogen III oxidase [Verrucomicrobiota bacterium]MBS0637791.1 oxygen-independent coproporphyrinogen III oxidase [Verrucomicrobiota bacterium]
MHTLDLLLALDKPIPRYTSYPTAPEWGSIGPEEYRAALKKVTGPVSLYFHIPFCRTMCLFCGCSVVLNRKVETEERYVDYLIREMELVCENRKIPVCQLHFGGGTPTKLSCELLSKLMSEIRKQFDILPDAEIAIEIDPRTVHEDRGEKLHLLRELGFNRVSFGVQDTNEKVQEAVRRRQSYEVTKYTYDLARSLKFDAISLDLIYGLPYQTVETFSDTIAKIIDMRPDRLSLFSYAKIPWMKAHQKAIPDETLPSTEEKFRIYLLAREELLKAGYKAIGMDHFALPTDDMATKPLQRNFQGYTVLDVEDLLSFGITAIGYCQEGYYQNVKELDTYYSLLDRGVLPVFRGKVLTEDDRIRRWVIQRLMCDFKVDKGQFFSRYNIPFDSYFAEELTRIQPLLVKNDSFSLQATEQGSLFIRNVTSLFDYYLAQKEGHKSFSQAI